MLLDKKEIALRHTNQAIKMFFHKEDPVSTLVVACAANHILHALVCKKGLHVLFGYKGLFEKILIKEEYQKEFNKKRNEAYNFFKHADKDFDKTINFNPDLVWNFLLENIVFIKQLDLEFSIDMGYFVLWLVCTQKTLFLKNGLCENYLKFNKINLEELFENYDHFTERNKYNTQEIQKYKKWLF